MDQKKKFQKLHQFDVNLSAYLNQHNKDDEVASHSNDLNVVFKHDQLKLKAWADIEVGKEHLAKSPAKILSKSSKLGSIDKTDDLNKSGEQ